MKNSLIPISFLKTPTDNSSTAAGLKDFWKKVFPLISYREKHFSNVWKNAAEEEIFAELVFCLFTPQSKAVLCWSAVNDLADKNMIFNSKGECIAKVINKVRFRNNKAKYLIEARKLFTIDNKIKIKEKLKSFKNIYELRKWLIDSTKGIGYKEAGHFLRNIGIGKDLAILDRHILKNLKVYGAIKELPKKLNVKTYLETEKQMQDFAKNIGIPMSHLDMLFWCKNTGGIFK
ncbi:putative N-glycosylase/DNA lyase [Endomicrobiia bacterium]|uniref:8-oxoguanine DNA glycosylase/AP lyase n=1 Tax=Endomicrobium trichonymphae TaxID=1408204 RepID=B1GYL9_ENDTX|nr:N-glycosylase/DNA lyase [Candidatus Endomicrobium trichonymphae]GHT09685.1 putative N-glycosylase/DNA lyase [Endomicrobiia bacterium]BAG14112.1 putative 8-oxoguanine DNA glycosylase and DNA lyase [Candidatus Endomicrobium trichonymphae]BAV59170.1 putative 8-oxoguanine DNA glycosylase and DNA lyase [Candidatus Endomicrobium trichonymphae]GHT14675.1 putative N-glycosylase/DNA lyase [Endomicrobiia bacterium]GHT17703.1 putative N-glycosylase/DNA lyase [Endomicrobiia bacterium]